MSLQEHHNVRNVFGLDLKISGSETVTRLKHLSKVLTFINLDHDKLGMPRQT